MYFEVYNQYYKPPQNFDSWKNEMSLFGLKSFYMGFLFLTWWEDWTYCLSFVLFGHENEGSEFLRKTISNMADSCKNIQKIKMLQQQQHKKSQIWSYRFLDEYTFFSTPSQCYPFFEEGNEFLTKLGKGSSFFF